MRLWAVRFGRTGGQLLSILGLLMVATAFVHTDSGFISGFTQQGLVFYGLSGALATLLGLGMSHWANAQLQTAEERLKLLEALREIKKPLEDTPTVSD